MQSSSSSWPEEVSSMAIGGSATGPWSKSEGKLLDFIRKKERVPLSRTNISITCLRILKRSAGLIPVSGARNACRNGLLSGTSAYYTPISCYNVWVLWISVIHRNFYLHGTCSKSDASLIAEWISSYKYQSSAPRSFKKEISYYVYFI